MSDLIDRQAAIEAINHVDEYNWQSVKAIKTLPSAQPEPCKDVVIRNAIIQKLNTMDRYVSEELRLCDTDKKFPKNEVFIVDDVYEEIVENLPSAQPEVAKDTNVPSNDCISRQAVLDLVNSDWKYEGLEEPINSMPPVTPQSKMGRWINAYPDIEPDPMFMYGICSVCGFKQSISNKLNYCPNCGCRMEGESKE